MNILIAGGAGFIGTNLANKLCPNHAISIIDNLSTGDFDNLKPIETRITFYKHDIVKPLPEFLTKFDVIINLACPAAPPKYQAHPISTLRVSSIGTENLIELTLKHKARLLHASTSEVYGDPKIHPQSEDYWGWVNPYGPRSMYDEGKRYAESLIWSYRNQYNLNSGIIRIFNTYGPHMQHDDGRVITNFVHQALLDIPLTIYGEGNQTRSFCYIDDQVEAWEKMIVSNTEGPINIGNPEEFTMLELISILEEILEKNLKKKFLALPQDDPQRRRPDITKAKELLGWQPKINLKTGITKMIEWIHTTQPKGWV